MEDHCAGLVASPVPPPRRRRRHARSCSEVPLTTLLQQHRLGQPRPLEGVPEESGRAWRSIDAGAMSESARKEFLDAVAAEAAAANGRDEDEAEEPCPFGLKQTKVVLEDGSVDWIATLANLKEAARQKRERARRLRRPPRTHWRDRDAAGARAAVMPWSKANALMKRRLALMPRLEYTGAVLGDEVDFASVGAAAAAAAAARLAAGAEVARAEEAPRPPGGEPREPPRPRYVGTFQPGDGTPVVSVRDEGRLGYESTALPLRDVWRFSLRGSDLNPLERLARLEAVGARAPRRAVALAKPPQKAPDLGGGSPRGLLVPPAPARRPPQQQQQQPRRSRRSQARQARQPARRQLSRRGRRRALYGPVLDLELRRAASAPALEQPSHPPLRPGLTTAIFF